MSLERAAAFRPGVAYDWMHTTRETVPMLIANRPSKGCDQLRTKGLGG